MFDQRWLQELRAFIVVNLSPSNRGSRSYYHPDFAKVLVKLGFQVTEVSKVYRIRSNGVCQLPSLDHYCRLPPGLKAPSTVHRCSPDRELPPVPSCRIGPELPNEDRIAASGLFGSAICPEAPPK